MVYRKKRYNKRKYSRSPRKRFTRQRRRRVGANVPTYGTMMATYEVELPIFNPIIGDRAFFFVGDHPSLGVTTNIVPITIDDKYGDLSDQFQYCKPHSCSIKYIPHLSESVVIGTTQFALPNITMAYDQENTIAALQSSAAAGSGEPFRNWLADKEGSFTLNPYKQFNLRKKIYPRTRIEADGTVVKQIGKGFYSTKFQPGFGHWCFMMDKVPPGADFTIDIGTLRVRWTCTMRSAGEVNPP